MIYKQTSISFFSVVMIIMAGDEVYFYESRFSDSKMFTEFNIIRAI